MSPTEAWQAVMNLIRSQDLAQLAARQQALTDLLQSWEEFVGWVEALRNPTFP